MNDETFKRQHEVNVKTKGMKPMRSVMKLCGKMARILVSIALSGKAYEPNRAMPMKQVLNRFTLRTKIGLFAGFQDCTQYRFALNKKGIVPPRHGSESLRRCVEQRAADQ